MHNAIKCIIPTDAVREHLQSWCPIVLIRIIDQYAVTTVKDIFWNRGLTDDADVQRLYTVIKRVFSDTTPVASTGPVTVITGTGFAFIGNIIRTLAVSFQKPIVSYKHLDTIRYEPFTVILEFVESDAPEFNSWLSMWRVVPILNKCNSFCAFNNTQMISSTSYTNGITKFVFNIDMAATVTSPFCECEKRVLYESALDCIDQTLAKNVT